jgi:uncharacterized protein YgiM (DUF1202 family)
MRSRIFISAVSLALWTAAALPILAQQPAPAAKAPAAAPTPQFPFEGEVSATNVYLRSGPGVNYYPSTKLNAGDRIVVQGEKFGWYQVVPPTKCFSYIDMAKVDKQPGGKTGKVNDDKVYVRAGSDLEKGKTSTQVVLDKGATVNILGEADGFYKITPPPGASLWVSKQYVEVVPARLKTGLVERHAANAKPVEGQPITPGTEPPPAAPAKAATPNPATAVKPPAANAANATKPPAPAADKPTTGTPVPATKAPAGPTPAPTPEPAKTPVTGGPETPKIPPEAGATPSDPNADADIVDEDDGEPPLETDSATPGEPAPGAPAPAAKTPPTPKAKPAKGKIEKPGEFPQGSARWSALLTVLESELRAASQGALDEQALTGLQARYTEIATQTDDKVSAQVAQIRIEQLANLISLRAGKSAILADVKDLDDFRSRMEEERMKIRGRRLAEMELKFDLTGELRQSYAFAPEKRRYRLVDPANQSTLAYVDIPPTLDVKPDELIGQQVGIITSSLKFNPATQVPLAVAKKVVDLSPQRNPPPAPKPEDSSNPGNKPAANPKTIDKGTPTKGAPEKGSLSAGPTQEAPRKPVATAGEGSPRKD